MLLRCFPQEIQKVDAQRSEFMLGYVSPSKSQFTNRRLGCKGKRMPGSQCERKPCGLLLFQIHSLKKKKTLSNTRCLKLAVRGTPRVRLVPTSGPLHVPPPSLSATHLPARSLWSLSHCLREAASDQPAVLHGAPPQSQSRHPLSSFPSEGVAF